MQEELFPREDEGMYYFEDQALGKGFCHIAGVDEAGRGPLAGPVVAAAVILPNEDCVPAKLNDSKKLTARQRAQILEDLNAIEGIQIGVGIVDSKKIDEINILNATHLAMKLAVEDLRSHVDYCLVDGLPVKGLPVDHKAIVKGDGRSYSIAAASIVAKERRDQMMVDYAEQYPEYGFEKHKGYGTKIHNEALKEHGPCSIHRYSYAPVRNAVKE